MIKRRHIIRFENILMMSQMQQQVEEIWQTIDKYLEQRPLRKNLQNDITKQLRKIKSIINSSKQPVPQSFKKSVQNKQKKIKQTLEKVKPVVMITQEQRTVYREEICTVLKNIDKKMAALYEKKDNKKRQASIQFFKFHQNKLAMFAEWLLSPTRNFQAETMKKLFGYIKDLIISHEDQVFQEQLNAIYEKIIVMADEPAQLSQDLFLSSFQNIPKVNDYLLSKQTKEILPRNPIVPQYKMIDLSVIPKMQKQILFLMFYYHKGETEQYLAAKQLMQKSWRFYKKFNIWLKRTTNPTFDNNEYETGKYLSVNSELVIKERAGIKVYRNWLLRELK